MSCMSTEPYISLEGLCGNQIVLHGVLSMVFCLQEDDLYRTLKQNKLLAMHIGILHQSRVHVGTSSFPNFPQ